jgi:hypothetical protein
MRAAGGKLWTGSGRDKKLEDSLETVPQIQKLDDVIQLVDRILGKRRNS